MTKPIYLEIGQLLVHSFDWSEDSEYYVGIMKSLLANGGVTFAEWEALGYASVPEVSERDRLNKLSRLVNDGFSWSSTSQGSPYWSEFARRIANKGSDERLDFDDDP